MDQPVGRINRAVADCLILCAYSQDPPQDTAEEYVEAMRRDPMWDDSDVDRVRELVLGLLTRLSRTNREGWIK